ncbi:hypothetical protein JHK87_009907 [Glycine soja]|nr:hypothetical protein JHK87_009907 [Glycine soja]
MDSRIVINWFLNICSSIQAFTQMDLETENRLATMLMREVAELRRQSEREGVLAYLRKPNIRTRPNSCFLIATVRGVQQANRVVEVNEMWRLRQKEDIGRQVLTYGERPVYVDNTNDVR